MDFISLLAIAVGLGMDCFAVSIAAGIAVRESRLSVISRIAILFGLFQTGMTLLGWAGGSFIIAWIEPFDHWIAAILLGIIGGKMIQEGLSDSDEKGIDFYSVSVLLLLAVATSIDALAVGLSLAVLKVQILIPALIIGVCAVVMSGAGFLIGERFGDHIGSKAEIIGGIVLIFIGLKILAEHIIGG
ncbi:manganese efflux pump MntP [Methanospirillum lacunae]|uniref:Putative manganese efflux pump MntP n=1 Tax=Methanospirillum lacunae TaxID=668570 RepID=A0A2V2MTI1_9EURY|nr:manganese efflux pump MntP family protein [Methanospirillum lacunae]PWR71504.1 hypothetical protein DK846_11625 [Methanospirillum lacunae]